jgi:hypothetical protein
MRAKAIRTKPLTRRTLPRVRGSAVNRVLREWLKTKGVKVTEIETPGMHTWMGWRRNPAEFAPLLFR